MRPRKWAILAAILTVAVITAAFLLSNLNRARADVDPAQFAVVERGTMLSATGEGFRPGNENVLREFGRNIVIIRRGRTSMQAGGELAGRLVALSVADARALAAQSRLLKVVGPEIICSTASSSA